MFINFVWNAMKQNPGSGCVIGLKLNVSLIALDWHTLSETFKNYFNFVYLMHLCLNKFSEQIFLNVLKEMYSFCLSIGIQTIVFFNFKQLTWFHYFYSPDFAGTSTSIFRTFRSARDSITYGTNPLSLLFTSSTGSWSVRVDFPTNKLAIDLK